MICVIKQVKKKKTLISLLVIIMGLLFISTSKNYLSTCNLMQEENFSTKIITANPPSVNITNIHEGDQFEAPYPVIINVTIEDDDTSVSEAKALINSPSMSLNFTMEESMGTWSASWDNISKYELGTYTITIWASDENDEINQTQSVNIELIDTTNPYSNDLTLEEPFRTFSYDLDWILYDNYEAGGEYRVWCSDFQGSTSMVRDWTPWSNGTNLRVEIDTAIPGIFNYSIEYRDGANLYGISDSVIVNVSEYIYLSSDYNPTIIDLSTESGISLIVNVSSDAVLKIDEQSDPFSHISKVNNGDNFVRYYHIRIFNWTREETSEMLESAVVRFYYEPNQIKMLDNLRVYRFDGIDDMWTNIDYEINIAGNYVEFTTTDFPYFAFFELEETSVGINPFGSIDPFSFLIVVLLSTVGISAVSSYVIISRKNKKKGTTSDLKRKKYLKSTQSQILKAATTIKKKKVSAIKAPLKEPSLTEVKTTTKEVIVQERADICQVHRGPIKGLIFSCPKCSCKYCVECALNLEEKNEGCWSCNEPLEVKKSLPILKEVPRGELSVQDVLNASIDDTIPKKASFIDILPTIESSLTVVSKDFLERIDQIPWRDDLEKESFIKEMLSYTPEEQEDFINEMLGDTLDLTQGRETGE
ncbi:MAG: hypothetical protein JW891_16545 [Candidatus Lokiarchaeota archaeon]|nr:hypothetical protein [Candidatus Lokiarchaeota archaeon]